MKTLPFAIGVGDFVNEELSVRNDFFFGMRSVVLGVFALLSGRLQNFHRDSGGKFGVHEEWARKALNSNVENSMLRGLDSVARDPLESLTQVDDQGTLDWLYRSVFAIKLYLETVIPKGCQ